MCYICGRSSCCPSFHSRELQKAYEPAGEAYDRFLVIRQECKEKWREEEEIKHKK